MMLRSLVVLAAAGFAVAQVTEEEEAAGKSPFDDADHAAYVSSAPEGDSVVFFDNFDDEATFESNWVVTSDVDYEGEFGLSAGENSVQDGDLGLEIKHEAKKHGISAKFDSPVQLGTEPLVLQYEVEIEKPHTCGGLYIKLLRADSAGLKDQSKLNGDSDYTIMFGPDKCGDTNKVHFILKHENPKTKEFEEHHAEKAPASKGGASTHLYTLVIQPDNTYEYFIDNESAGAGNLLETMEPPVNPPKQIDDPEEVEAGPPEDWIHEPQMDDPEASKPDDWDEDAPEEILDEKATIPEDWDEDAEFVINDPSAVMPDDWDEEEDGAWEAPRIDNPDCATHGCEKWTAPMIANPEYKGKWACPQVDNPEYKGQWAPAQIDNPNWFEDLTPLKNTAPIGGLAIEIWTMSGGIFFDNMLVTTDPVVAKTFAITTWGVKAQLEKEAAAAKTAGSDPMKMATDLVEQAAVLVEGLGVPAEYSTIAVLSALAVVVLTTFLMFCTGGGEPDPTEGLEPTGGAAEAEAAAAAEEPEAEVAEEEEEEEDDK